MDHVLGIDLGTSNTCAAIMLDGEPRVVADDRGRSTTPSVLAVHQNGKYLVGHLARSQMVSNPYGTVHSVKRLIGQHFQAPNVQRALGYLPYEVVEAPDGSSMCMIGDHRFSPVEVSAAVLRKVKEMAEEALGEPLTKAVITVPAHFTNTQRKATKAAAERADLEVLRLINEPTAAALAYGLEHGGQGRVAVFDFGGGTFDVSVLEIRDEVFEVISTGGDSYLGGDDFNRTIAEHLSAVFRSKTGINLALDRMATQRVLDAAEIAKIQLSTVEETRVFLPRIAASVDASAALDIMLTRVEIEEMCEEYVDDALRICEETFTGARVGLDDIDQVVMVGGMSRMPLVRRKAVTFFGRDLVEDINPDEVVAIGAAIQGEALVNLRRGVLLLDVVPMSLGIRAKGDVFSPLIMRNTKVPHRTSHTFTTSVDNQARVTVSIYQGESQDCMENTLLGEFELTGIQPAPRMTPQIEVTFRIDPDGILSVTARDLDSQRSNTIEIADIAEQAQQQTFQEGDQLEPSNEVLELDAL